MIDVPEGNVWDEGRWAGVDRIDLDFMTRYIVERLTRRINPVGKHLLELGAGTGRLSYLLLQAGAASVTLVDNAQKALALSAHLFRDQEPQRYSIVDGDALACSFETPFDWVFSSGLIEHFQGAARRQVVAAHLRHAREGVIFLHPSNRWYNRVFDHTPMARRRYGFARTFSESELEVAIRQHRPDASVSHERFHLCYTIPLLHNWERINRAVADRAVERRWGGLCLSQVLLGT